MNQFRTDNEIAWKNCFSLLVTLNLKIPTLLEFESFVVQSYTPESWNAERKSNNTHK